MEYHIYRVRFSKAGDFDGLLNAYVDSLPYDGLGWLTFTQGNRELLFYTNDSEEFFSGLRIHCNDHGVTVSELSAAKIPKADYDTLQAKDSASWDGEDEDGLVKLEEEAKKCSQKHVAKLKPTPFKNA